MSLPKFSKGAISTIQRHSTDGITTFVVGKRIDAETALLLPLQRSTLGRCVNSRKRRRRSETPRLCTICFCTDVCFVSQIHRTAIDPGLATMYSLAGAAAYASRTVRFTTVFFSIFIVQRFCCLDTTSIFRKIRHSITPKGKGQKDAIHVVPLSSTAAQA